MIRKVIVILLICLIVFSSAISVLADNATNSEDYIPSENVKTSPIELTGNLLVHIETDNYFQLKELINECEQRKNDAHNMAEAARACGYAENHPVIILAKNEWEIANSLYIKYKEKYSNIVKLKAWKEYPVATECWVYLKSLGYNDYVCAGILGNMMAEVGGGTLDLQWDLGDSFYGLCQWSTYYRPEAKGLNVQKQLELLKNTIKEEIDYAGFIYKYGFDYNQFIQMENTREAALAFAMTYERCAKQYYYIRCDYAEIAYNYFVG